MGQAGIGLTFFLYGPESDVDAVFTDSAAFEESYGGKDYAAQFLVLAEADSRELQREKEIIS